MNKIRLPKHIKPERYQLTIKPDLNGFTFTGSETIFLRLEKSTREITLHAKDLKIFDVEYSAKSQKVKPAQIKYDKKAETATFIFKRALKPGQGRLALSFAGVLQDNMRGFYRSRYTHQGKEKHMATTQFEATDARRAFPCFDEPAQKAIFDVTLMVPKDMTAISNTIETSIAEHEAGYKVVKFAPSPKMSTYLLAFIVGDFEFIEGKTKDGVLVRVFVTPGKKHQAKFALETSIKVLEFYNQYFDIPYPLPVLDLIAIPDFSHGAMENWGAVTYRESALLVDPEHSSASNKQWVALVIAHELAHQWFGNLVTMEWWTHLWLNEGFASYIEYLAVDHVFPSWDIWTQFAYADLGVALKLDALKHTHPIEIEVGHPDEIGEIFDEISYSKGASVIRMLAGYLGEKDFRDGLRHYLKKHSYKNASTIHLWEAFEKISKKPVRKVMENWTSKAGYPIIHVMEKSGSLHFNQSRFYSSPLSKKSGNDKTLWQIPVDIFNLKSKRRQHILFGQSRFLAPGFKNGEPIKINLNETGYFRVKYSAQMLESLKSFVKSKQISALDRLGLVRDVFALAESGEKPTAEVLDFLSCYENETDYTVWVEIISGLSSLKNLLHGQAAYPKFQEFCLKLLQKISKEIGWQKKKLESHTAGLLRSMILSQLIGFGHKPTIAHGQKIFKSGKIPADIRSVAYQAQAAAGSEKAFNQFVSMYVKETLSEEKNRIGRALAQFKDPKLLKKTLEFDICEHVRIQDTQMIFAGVWANTGGRQMAFEQTKKNWPLLLKRYPSSGHMLNRFIKPAASFTTEKQAQMVKEFYKKHPAPGAERSIEQTLEKILSNAAWLERDLQMIVKFLSKI